MFLCESGTLSNSTEGSVSFSECNRGLPDIPALFESTDKKHSDSSGISIIILKGKLLLLQLVKFRVLVFEFFTPIKKSCFSLVANLPR